MHVRQIHGPRVLRTRLQEHLLRGIVKQLRRGLVVKAHRLLYHSTLVSRRVKKTTLTVTSRYDTLVASSVCELLTGPRFIHHIRTRHTGHAPNCWHDTLARPYLLKRHPPHLRGRVQGLGLRIWDFGAGIRDHWSETRIRGQG